MSDLEILKTALTTNTQIAFEYSDKARRAEVHTIGLGKGDKIMVAAWQTTHAPDEKPGWKLFELAKMSGLMLSYLPSEAPREGYKMNDSRMSSIIAQVQI